jgi:chaperonin cofactor prefoldin
MVYDSMGKDRQLTAITLITLAAMLDRTEGMRARHCRSILLEDRSEDFYEGMNLYERFIHSGEKLFAEQDFMTDVMAEITDLRQQAQQLINDKQLLQKQIKEMENQTKHIGYNVENMVINMSGGTLVQHADLVQASGDVKLQNLTAPTPISTAEDHVPQKDEYSFFGTDKFAAYICVKNLRETIANAKSKADACRNIMTLDTCGYQHIRHLTDARKAELINPFATPKYVFTGEDFKKARNNPTKLKSA